MPTFRRIGLAATAAAALTVGGLGFQSTAASATTAGTAATSRSVAPAPQVSAASPLSDFGASINTPDDVGRLSTLLGRPMTSARVFLSSIPSSWAKNSLVQAIPANGTLSVSWQSGSPAAVQNFLSGRPAGMKCYATYFHEPEDNLTTAVQKTDYMSAWHAYAPAIRAAGCVPTLILMKWSLNPKSGRNWHDWYPVGDVDVLGFDAYNTRAKLGTYGIPANYLAPILAAATETGLPWALTELGSDIPAGTSPADRAAWAHGVAVAAAAQPNFLFADWWDVLSKDGSRDYRLDSTTAQVWQP